MTDIFDVLVVYAGIFGVALGSYLTYYYQDIGRKQSISETVLRIGEEVLLSFQALQIHVGLNEDRLARATGENWDKQTPKTRTELDSVLDYALGAFPFPLPEAPMSGVEEPFSAAVKDNVRWTRKLIEELNGSAEALRLPKGRTDENIATFLARLQLFRNAEMVAGAMVAIEGNLYEGLYFAKGMKLKKKQKEKLLKSAREAISEDYENRISLLRKMDEGRKGFAETLKQIR